jgi:YegS/Rv2252/BmrU family lipid kinase
MGDRRFRAPWVILNPRAGSGKAKRKWPALRPLFEHTLGPVNARFTKAPNHATELAREALGQGADLVVAIGGDGTMNEVVNGYFIDGKAISPDAALALCPFGTGGDFRRSARIPESTRAAIDAIVNRPAHEIDALRVRLTSANGLSLERYCVNVTSFGLGGEVSVAAKNSFLTRYSGRAAFLWATALTFVRYRAKGVRLAVDREEPAEAVPIVQVALGNGAYQGGGMRICPLAQLDSGLLEVTLVKETGFMDFIRSLPLLYSGKVYSHPNCHHFRARRVAAYSDETVAVEVDGEAIGNLPLEAEILPSAIKMAGIATSS